MTPSRRTGYRASAFNFFVDIDGEKVLFNALTGNLLCVPAECRELADLDPVHERILAESGFLVTAAISDEFDAALAAILAPSRRLYLVLTLATDCDLRCAYCFENRERRRTMSDRTLDLACQWVERQFESGRFDQLNVILFGGEPLLAPRLLLHALDRLKRIETRYALPPVPILLTTNALSGDPALFATLRAKGVTQVQVSFDGDRARTNGQRKSRKIADVYAATLARLPLLAERFDLTIKLNFTPESLAGTERLFADLRQTLAGLPFRVKPEPIARHRPAIAAGADHFDSHDIAMAAAFAAIFRSAERAGIDIDASAVFNTPCMAYRSSSYLLEPGGALRSCISAFGMDSFAVGNIETGADHNGQAAQLQRRKQALGHCVAAACPFLPMCGGGCPYDRELAGAAADGLDCRLEYFRAALPILVGHAWRGAAYKRWLL